jgi:hypothetical protein
MGIGIQNGRPTGDGAKSIVSEAVSRATGACVGCAGGVAAEVYKA